MTSQGRVPELDGVRGIAILMVLFYHGFASAMVTAPYAWSGFPAFVETVAGLGWIGVDIFFVLSGYLITGILLSAAGKPHYFRNFYARRALRILPLYYLVLIFIAVWSRGSGDYVLLGVFYLSNFAPIFGVAALYGPLWSLSVEEHFYLMWPWLISRLKISGIRTLAVLLCVTEPIARAVAFHRWPTPASEFSNLALYSWFHFDGLAAGALLACFVRSRRRSGEKLFFLGLVCAGGAMVTSAFISLNSTVFFSLKYTCSTLIGVAVMSLVLSREIGALGSMVRSKWLVKTGELSYCLYIIHLMVFFLVWNVIGGEFPTWLVSRVGPFGTVCVGALAAFTVSFALAGVSRRYFEGPILRLKRYFAYSGFAVADAARVSVTPAGAEAETTGNG